MNNNKTHKVTEPKESKQPKNEAVSRLRCRDRTLLPKSTKKKHFFLSPAKSILEEIAKKIIESSIKIVFDG